eukprot:s2901_g10.t1
MKPLTLAKEWQGWQLIIVVGIIDGAGDLLLKSPSTEDLRLAFKGEGEGFKQELSVPALWGSYSVCFSPVDPAEPAASVSVCVGQDRTRERTRISVLADCDSGDLVVVARFGARQIGHRAAGDRLFCVESVGENDVFREPPLQREKDKCTSKMKFEFALPAKAEGPELLDPQLLSRRPRLCTGFRKNRVVTGVDQQCDTLESLTLDFEALGLPLVFWTWPSQLIPLRVRPLYTPSSRRKSPALVFSAQTSSSRPWAYRCVDGELQKKLLTDALALQHCGPSNIPTITSAAEKAQKKSTGFGSGLTVKESKAKKRSSSSKTPEELPATFGIGKGPRLAIRQGAALAGDLDPFEELKLTEWPTVILGADVLAQERLVFSFRQNKMWMTPGTGSSISATPIDV